MSTENNSKKQPHKTDAASADKNTSKKDIKPSESEKLQKEAGYTSEVKDKVKESMNKKEKE